MNINPEIENWIRAAVLPRYDNFDRGHRRDHAEYVIRTALELVRNYDVNPDMIAVAAACHDIGLQVDRATHHLKLWIPESRNAARLEELRTIIRNPAWLRKIFDAVYEEEISRK